MNKAQILKEEQRQGRRLLEMRRELNARLSGGAKQLIVSGPGRQGPRKVPVTLSNNKLTLQNLKSELGDSEIWTHNNLQVADRKPALGPWITVSQLLRLSKPRVQLT